MVYEVSSQETVNFHNTLFGGQMSTPKLKVNFSVHLQSLAQPSKIFSTSKLVRPLANS